MPRRPGEAFELMHRVVQARAGDRRPGVEGGDEANLGDAHREIGLAGSDRCVVAVGGADHCFSAAAADLQYAIAVLVGSCPSEQPGDVGRGAPFDEALPYDLAGSLGGAFFGFPQPVLK
ncbi:hypothetical protein D3C75_1096320 [compost metagenome]